MTLNKTVGELEQITAKIKIQTFYKIIGFLLVPLIIGIFVIKKANKNLHYLIYSKEKTIDNVKRDIKKALKEVEDTHEQIKREDTYLIYSVRETITGSINQYLRDLSFLESRKKLFQDEFNSFVNDSYNHMVSIKEKVLNFNSEFIKRRIRDYDYLFKKSSVPLDNDQKTAIITDDKHNLVVAGAGSGKTEVLITRIAYLIERKPDTRKPERILALAYQKKAARKIKERLNERYDVDVTIKTFHSLGNQILETATKNSYLFSWDSVPGCDNKKLIKFLRDDFDIDWAENSEIRKSKDCQTIYISKDENSAEITIDEKRKKAILKISDGRTDDLKVKTENGKLNIYKNSKEGVPKLKFSGDNYEKEYNRFIKTLFKKAREDSELQNDLINYMKLYGDDEVIKKEVDFETKEEYYRYMCNLAYTTLDGRKVRSEAERAIMNFFISRNLNGKKVKILHEDPAKWMQYKDGKGEHIIPKPDFFLPEYDIYIEHWAVNKEGRVPEWFEGENPTNEYKRGMEAKQKKFQEQDKYVLVETTHGEFEEKNFLQLLEKKILKALEEKYPDKKFTFTSLSYDELVGRVWEECRESINAMPLNIARFIRIAKTYSSTPEDIERRLSDERWSPKQEAFAKIAVKLYKRYEKELRSANQIDFSDMINLAVKELKEKGNLYRNVFDHILIDEYQDISTQRYELIKALMEKNPDCKLFCVGDDWQSIMGFTGSDLDFFVKFDGYFDHPARTDLTINYRSIKSVVDTGAEIIKHNGDAQLKKETIATNQTSKPIKVYSLLHKKDCQGNYYRQSAEHCVKSVSEYLKRGYKPEDIMILTRIINTPKIIRQMIGPLLVYANKTNVPISKDSRERRCIRLMTVHGSKGLEARVVFILNVVKDMYGFPCELEDPSIFEPAITGRKKDKEEEERRLFYVAVTRAKEDVIIYTQKCVASKFLKEIENQYLFSWDTVPGNDSDIFLKFLRNDLDIDWTQNAEISKSDDDKTICIIKDESSAEIVIDEKKEKATLKISDGRTCSLQVKKEGVKLNIYENRINVEELPY